MSWNCGGGGTLHVLSSIAGFINVTAALAERKDTETEDIYFTAAAAVAGWV